MAINTCAVTGNVKNLLNSPVSNCKITVSVQTPFFHTGSWISGEISTTTTESSGDFSISVIETETVGKKVVFTFDYYDGVGNRKLKKYAVMVPDSTTVALSDLVASDITPIVQATFPAASVTVSTISGLTSDDAQAALAEIEAQVQGKQASGDYITALTGDVTATGPGSVAATVATVGGSTAADVHTAEVLANAATDANTASTIVKRDASGDFSAGTITADLVGDVTGSATTFTGDLSGDVTSSGMVTSISGLARSKIAAGTASHVVINDGSGNLSSEAQLAISRGGTGQATTSAAFDALSPNTTKGDLTVRNSSANARLGVGTDGQVLTADSAQTLGVKWADAAAANSPFETTNLSVAASVSSNALTVALKDKAGSDPSAGSAVKIAFRIATATDGSYVQRSVTSALSIVVPSGATLGHVSGADEFIHLYAVDNAGTVDLAVSGGRVFDEGSLQNTTAIDTSADTRCTLYASSTLSGVAVKYLGRIKVNEATAGTYATAPSEVSQLPQPTPYFRIADIVAATGSRVTGSAPSALGEYRSYLRASSAYTYSETNGTPTTTPSSANGFKMYGGFAHTAADTNSQPTRYDIFVGKNKRPVLRAYLNTGRTGYIDTSVFSGNNDYGLKHHYDSSTGVFIVQVNSFLGSSATRNPGTNETANTQTACYFDILVWDR